MKTKAKTKLYALLLAVALLFASLFGLGGVLRAHASDGLPSGDDLEYTSLYYISDYAGSGACFNNGYLRTYINSKSSITKAERYYGEPRDFWAVVEYFYNAVVNEIGNAYIIFEVRDSMPTELVLPDNADDGYTTDQIFQLMNDMFSELKGSGCKIMFICGTDESRFNCDGKELPYKRNNFLRYVDIHVNSDLRTMYHYTAIKRMEGILGDSWGNTTIVLDTSIGDSWWFYKELILYFISTYYSQISFQPLSPENILAEMGVTVFFYRPGSYVDPNAVADVSEGYFMQTWELAEHRFIITAPQTTDNQELWGLDSYGSGATYLYTFDYDASLLDVELPDIMYDFIFDNDLSNYQNYPGRCKITHKTVGSSEDGWLYIPVYTFWLDLVTDMTAEMFPQDTEILEELADFLNSDPPEFAVWG